MYECNSREKPDAQKWNRLLDAVVTIIKYNKITIDHVIYIKFSLVEQCPILQFPMVML